MRVWILPMAGRGKRSQELGECKPAIQVLDRPILGWCLTGLSTVISEGDRVVITTTKYFEEKFGLSRLAQAALDDMGLRAKLLLVELDDVPPGPAASVYAAVDHFRNAGETVVVNSDQFVQFLPPPNGEAWEAYVPLYVNSTGRSSYAQIDDGRITRIVEKKLISNYASAGVYGFATGAVLARALETTFEGEPHHGGEYYVGPAINEIIRSGGRVLPSSLVAKYDLGGVPQIKHFEKIVNTIRGERK